MNMTFTAPTDNSRAKRLKAATSETHDRLDKRIMAGQPFAAVENYGKFLGVQCRFHRDIDGLFARAELIALIPDLPERRRLDEIRKDMIDLGIALPDQDEGWFDRRAIDLPTAFGWLYVAEGSNLGAAFLFKMARALGLDETYGARHLAGHPDGRAQHWRSFTAVLDAQDFDEVEETRLVEGAKAAFRRVHALVEAAYG